MQNFRQISIEDKQLFEKYYSGRKISSYESFSNMLMWQAEDKLEYAVINGFLCVVGINSVSGKRFSYMPVGGDNSALCDTVLALKAEYPDIIFTYLKKGYTDKLNTIFGEKAEISEERDLFEYIYEAEKLRTLSGKALHAKRNHINKFEATYESRFDMISSENKAELEAAILALREDPALEENKTMLVDEDAAIDKLYENFDALGLTAGVLYADGNIAAYTIGEMINGDTALIHVEKAHRDIEGAYTVVNQRFITEAFPTALYANREEDMGVEGLRKAKLSYSPLPFDKIYSAKINS